MDFLMYRKTTPTVARVLTENDYHSRGGIIQTNEGPSAFLPGDYLAKDRLGEWPIPVAVLRERYRRTGEVDADGFVTFTPLDVREAKQMTEAFLAGGLFGKPGDYLVRSGESEWVVDRAVFEATYTLVE
ncbi:MAG TPA: hypothetical protein VFA10_14455 [Ktedonobacteraceae bacterium]|nr:hypothetical protein [Ktedonobacteraceae bacterium]